MTNMTAKLCQSIGQLCHAALIGDPISIIGQR